jgi:hypothetical protein
MISKYGFPSFILAELSMVIGLILIMQSCSKDEFTRPVSISLSVMINEQYKTNNTLSFEKGEIALKQINFSGKREVGEDYSFNTESGKEFGQYTFYPDNVNAEAITDFDLPQGIYTQMMWKFQLFDGLKGINQDDDGDDDDNYETPGLSLGGQFIKPDGEIVKIRIEIDPFESFECMSVAETGDKNINIISGRTYNAILYMDPYFVFRAISSESLKEADYSDDELLPVLLISSSSNEDLYEIILFRLQQSVKIVVR